MIDIDIKEENRAEIAQRLNNLFANEYILYTKTLKYHWNVKGAHFGALHALFRAQYEQFFLFIDTTAERVTSLGFEAFGTLDEFMKNSMLTEYPGENPNDHTMINNLLDDHQKIIKQLREDIDLTIELNDAGTNNFLSDLIEKHEKIAWMLRAHLE